MNSAMGGRQATGISAPPHESATESPPRVLIVGGGLAGMAAASLLAPAGCAVTLIESRPKLGGRATSFLDPSTGEWVDNCQHVSMGCCTQFADFCRRVGIDHLIDTLETLYFRDEKGRISRMSAARLPAPLHLAPSFLTASFLTLGEKIRVARGLLALVASPAEGPTISFRQWLLEHGQTERTIDRFWGVVLVSALNETLDRMEFRYARQVFIEGFMRSGRSFVVQIPRVPLGEFYGSLLIDNLTKMGADVRMGTAVEEIHIEDRRAVGCRLKHGETLAADAVILAVPFHRASDLVATSDESLAGLEHLESSPITSVHLWYDRPVMTHPHLVVIGRQTQWLFRRSWDEGGYVQAVVSASRELSALGADEVRARIIREVEEILPAARGAQLQHHRVVTERRATFSVLPGVDRWRPGAPTSIDGLYLAGDYTETGWPATMEGAVRGGNIAAGDVLARFGRSAPAIPDALPTGGLYRFLEWLLASPQPVKKEGTANVSAAK